MKWLRLLERNSLGGSANAEREEIKVNSVLAWEHIMVWRCRPLLDKCNHFV